MKPTWRAESIVMPPILREENAVEKRALRDTTGSLSDCLMLINLKM